MYERKQAKLHSHDMEMFDVLFIVEGAFFLVHNIE